MKNYAVLFAPEFRLQATLRYFPALAEKAVALLKVEGSKSRISERNASARAHQVHRGMTPTQALARCADLHLLQGNPGHERSAQDILLQTAETLSPFLEATAPGIITVELPGERVLTEADFLARWERPLRLLGLEVQIGVATTPDLALLAARFADPVKIVTDTTAFLAPLPVEALQPSDEILTVLDSWGIRTIGSLVALPMAQVCERLGWEAVGLWEQATGGRPRPLKLIKPQEFFVEQADLEHPVEMLEPLLFLLRRFLEQIMARLGNVYLVAGKLRLILRFEQGEPYQRIFIIPQPTRDVDLLFRMLHTHLENFTAAAAIIGLELAAKPVRPNAEQFGLLEKGVRDPHQFAETLARLHALLGADRVGAPVLEASRHPDAFQLRPYEMEAASPLEPEPEPLLGIPRLQFRPPVPAQIILHDKRPAFLYSAHGTGPIKETRGPWLLEGNWWESRHWSREEWDVATDEGIYRLVHVGEGWFLEGIYT